MSANWYPPLPPGWEARWDPNQNAYFFIDHASKATSWQDPRWNNQQQLSTPFSGSGGQGQAIQMQEMQRAPQQSPARTSHASPHRGETTFSDNQLPATKAIADRLRARFPDYEAKAVINDVLAMVGNDEDEATSQLISLGFHPARSAPSPMFSKRSEDSKGSRSRSGSAAASKAASPSRGKTSAAPSPHRQPQVSGDEKRKRKNKLCREFPSLEGKVVQMALEASSWDEDKTRSVLKSVSQKWEEQETPKHKSGSSGPSTSSSSRPFSPAAMSQPADLEPVAFGISPDERVTSAGAGRYRPSAGATGAKKATTGQQRQQTRAKHVTNVKKAERHERREPRWVVTHQPRQQRATTGTAGPTGGSGLACGPDPTLSAGHDSAYHAGADPTLTMGSMADIDGPNPEYYQGSNPEYHWGRVPYLAAGSCGSEGPQALTGSSAVPVAV